LTSLLALRKVTPVTKWPQSLVAGKLSFWKLNTIVWTLFAVFSVPTYAVIYPSFLTALASAPVQLLVALFLTAGMREVYRRPGISEPFQLKTAVWLVLLSFFCAGLHSLVLQVAGEIFGWVNLPYDPLAVWSVRWKLLWMIYMAWSFGYFWFKAEAGAREEHKRASRAEHQARLLELQLLRSQLDPHFLFNSLNQIAAEIPSHPGQAENMVLDLSDYLRYSLDHRNQPLTSVDEEVRAMREYLKIERGRCDGEVEVDFQVDASLLKYSLPFFILQPLVENAVKHAERNNGRLKIGLTVSTVTTTSGRGLCLEVTNDGTLPPDPGEGVGLSTLRRRLELHYPQRHHFQLAEAEGIVHARMVLEGKPCFA